MELDDILNGDTHQVETIYNNNKDEFIDWLIKTLSMFY